MSRLAHYPHPLTLSPADVEVGLRWAREFRPTRVAELEILGASGVALAVALRTKKDIIGVLLLGTPNGRTRYSAAEKEQLGMAADVFALTVENARLTERAVEQEKLRRDLALAAEVQRRLLPKRAPTVAIATAAGFSLPARIVGGDYYDFIDRGNDELVVAVADVSGKGVAAALLMSVIQASLRLIAARTDLPASRVAAQMNQFLHGSTNANKYATLFLAHFEGRDRRLTYVNAGHPPPYLIRRVATRCELIELSAGGTVLGLFPDVEYCEGRIDLASSDVVVAFTDGVTEALNASGEEFGEERLKAVLLSLAEARAEDIASRIATCLQEWAAGAEQHDDLTIVVVAVK